MPVSGSGRVPPAVRRPPPGCRGGPRHLIPPGGYRSPPESHRGGRIRAARGSPRGRGGALLSAFPLGITMPIPTHPALPAAGAAPRRRRAARLPRSWGGRRGKGERARRWGGWGGGVGGGETCPAKFAGGRAAPVAGTHGGAAGGRCAELAACGGVPGVLAPLRGRGSHVAEREAPGVRGKEQCCLSVPALISE